MDDKELLALVEEILEVDPNTVSLDSTLDDLDWDSLANITFIAEVDTRLGVSVNADQLAKAETVQDLRGLIAR